MKRLAIFLLMFCVTFGLAAQAPAQALARPMAQMDMASNRDMPAMSDCMASMPKDIPDKPCKCGLAGCIATMTSGVSMMLTDGSVAPTVVVAREQLARAAIVAALHGRSTPPEPEPPSNLV